MRLTHFMVLLVQATDWTVVSVSTVFGLVGEASWDDDARVIDHVPLRRVSPPSTSCLSVANYKQWKREMRSRQSIMRIACARVDWAKKGIDRSTGKRPLCGAIPMLEVFFLVLVLGRLKLRRHVSKRSDALHGKCMLNLHRRPPRLIDLVQ